jgi:hypothetical protein
MALQGTFSTMPFAELLQWLGDSRQTGTLSVALEFEERYLRFDDGRIVAYGSDDPMARDIGRLALSRGLVDEPALLRALEAQRRSHMPLSDVMVAEGAVAVEALEAAVRSHVEETVLGLFLWPEGRFTFSNSPSVEADEWMPAEYALSEPLDVRGLLMEGMRRLDEWKRIIKVLPSDDTQLHALTPADDLPILEEIAAHPHHPTLGELLAVKGDSRFSICEQLFRAFERGLLAVEQAPPRPDAETARGATTVAHLVTAAESLEREGQHEEAATLLRTALQLDPFRAEARALLGRVREAQIRELYAVLPSDHVPTVARSPESPSPRERRVLDRLNGRWDVAAVAMTSGLGELEALRALRSLVHAGAVSLQPPR